MENRKAPRRNLSLPDWPDLSRKKEDPYFSHEADIGIAVTGKSPEEAFVHVAEATFALMTDPSTVHPLQSVDVSFREADLELALVEWINLLLTESNIRRLVFSRFKLERKADRWHGRAFGEGWNTTHPRGIEVKGATLTQLSVKREGPAWSARLVVDV